MPERSRISSRSASRPKARATGCGRCATASRSTARRRTGSANTPWGRRRFAGRAIQARLEMDTRLDSLDIGFRIRAFELLARCAEARVPVIVVNTRRTAAEQADCVRRGVSWKAHSLHQDGRAIDIAPLSQYLLNGPDKVMWDVTDPVWEHLARIGESLGLVAGFRWPKVDAGHF